MSLDRLDRIVEAIHARFALVHGLNTLLAHEPRAIQITPTLYTLLDSFQRVDQAGQVSTTYRFMHRVVLDHAKDPAAGERDLRFYAEALPGQLRNDPTLGGLIGMGRAWISEALTGFVKIDGTEYRSLDLYSTVLDKVAGAAAFPGAHS